MTWVFTLSYKYFHVSVVHKSPISCLDLTFWFPMLNRLFNKRSKNVQPKHVQQKPTQQKPVQQNSVQQNPVQPVQQKPVDVKPVEVQPVEAKPVQTVQTVQTIQTVDTTPTEQRQSEKMTSYAKNLAVGGSAPDDGLAVPTGRRHGKSQSAFVSSLNPLY